MHSHSLVALVLASYDVGEADRFLILLTRERGRLAARVPGARKLKSKMGGLLPLTCGTVELKESNGNMLVAAVARCERLGAGDIRRFLLRMQGVELLLALLHDGEPVPEIFDAALRFLQEPVMEQKDLIAFSFRLLHLLGVLPEADVRLSIEERAFIAASALGAQTTPLPRLARLETLCRQMIAEHALRALKAPAVAAAMTISPCPAHS